MSNVHHGECFCGAVKLEVTGAPVAQGYCHCESSRHWSAGPVNAFSLWAPDGVKVTQGADLIGFAFVALARGICSACRSLI
jgi:hypothetical protein